MTRNIQISKKKLNYYNEERGYFLEANIRYPEQLGLPHSDLFFLFKKCKQVNNENFFE